MTNSWAMLFDYMYGGDDRPITDDATGTFEFPLDGIRIDEMPHAAGPVPIPGAAGEDTLYLGYDEVVITDPAPASGKDATFWKYNEGKILREVEEYLAGTYKGHYVGGDNKIQTLDLIDSNGDAEAFCRANIIKYASRFGKKDGKNPKALLKVIHYAFLLYHFADLPFTDDAKETFSALGR